MRACGPTFRRNTRLCNIRHSCARRVPDVRPCAARVGAAWYRVQKRGTTWHRVGRAANWDEHDVALRATRPVAYVNQCAVLRLTCVWSGFLVMKCIVNWQVHVAKNTRVCDETSRAGARTRTHARVQSNTRVKTKQSNIGYTRARCVRDVKPRACGSRGATERARRTRDGPRQTRGAPESRDGRS